MYAAAIVVPNGLARLIWAPGLVEQLERVGCDRRVADPERLDLGRHGHVRALEHVEVHRQRAPACTRTGTAAPRSSCARPPTTSRATRAPRRPPTRRSRRAPRRPCTRAAGGGAPAAPRRLRPERRPSVSARAWASSAPPRAARRASRAARRSAGSRPSCRTTSRRRGRRRPRSPGRRGTRRPGRARSTAARSGPGILGVPLGRDAADGDRMGGEADDERRAATRRRCRRG